MSMGEAYSAVADEASALYWNPAALTRIPKHSATLMHAAYIDSSFFDYAAYGQRLGVSGAWGAGLTYFSAGQMTETDATGTEVGTFSPHDLAFSVGYAHETRENVPAVMTGYSFGIAGKYIRSTILDSAQTWAVDLGILSPAYLDGKMRLALAVANLGEPMRFEQEREELPLSLRLGSAFKVGKRWLASMDLGFPTDNAPFAALGTEYQIPVTDDWHLSGRMGFNSRTIGDIDGFTGVSFGLGLACHEYGVSYAFLPLGSVGLAHRISLSFRF